MEPRPRHLAAEYAAHFQDVSVAERYDTRPPYPTDLFARLTDLLPSAPRCVLDLGCGTGDVTLGLAPLVDRVDALDPSAAMLRVASRRPGAGRSNIRWVHAAAEAWTFDGPYALIVAAESFHWMDWEHVVPKVSAALQSSAFLAIVTRDAFASVPWAQPLRTLIAAASINRDYAPFDLVAELTGRGLFREAGRHTTTPVPVRQLLDDYVESRHTRNGLSRERMTAQAARDFDEAVRSLVSTHCPGGTVEGDTAATLVWGRPGAGGL